MRCNRNKNRMNKKMDNSKNNRNNNRRLEIMQWSFNAYKSRRNHKERVIRRIITNYDRFIDKYYRY